MNPQVDASKIIFSDVNPDVNDSDKMDLVLNEDAINKSIVTILNTRKRTRVFNRDFGSNVMAYLFDPVDAATANLLGSEMMQAISQWEPRITISNIVVIPDYVNQAYYVSIEYSIPALLNKRTSFTFNLTKGV